MKYKYTDVVRDILGNSIASPEISVYLSGTTTPAKVYNTSGVAITSTPQIIGDVYGRVIFNMDDNDFALRQTFDIYIHKDGYDNLTKKDINILYYANQAGLNGIDGGSASSTYLAIQRIDGGNANG